MLELSSSHGINGLNAVSLTSAGKASSLKFTFAIGNSPLKQKFLKCVKPHIVSGFGPKP